jgi:hypothetical protein
MAVKPLYFMFFVLLSIITIATCSRSFMVLPLEIQGLFNIYSKTPESPLERPVAIAYSPGAEMINLPF